MPFRYNQLKQSKESGNQAKINAIIHATVPIGSGYKAKINVTTRKVKDALRFASTDYREQQAVGLTKTEMVAKLHSEKALTDGLNCGDVY